jgi:aminoglycoside phosphotransferase family enzyme/predicted kinase
MVEPDQTKLLEFMGRPEAYAPRPETVERIDTHASVVFLAGPFAYKVKRAVKYPFLDFSTLEKRHAACLNEIRINRRTAPQIYLEVVPVTVCGDGTFQLQGSGQVVEWVICMRRFDQEALYDRMAVAGQLALAAMGPLAEVIAAFHKMADRVLTQDQSVVPLAEIIRDNERMFAANPDRVLATAAKEFARQSRETLAVLTPLLKARALSGYVRHCHGDLHLRNIVEIDGVPVLFDAIEFDDRVATIDILYDLAFLLMDLGKRGLGRHANAVFNAYLDCEASTGNLVGLVTLPLFLSLRAMIRAKVELLRAQKAEGKTAAAVRNDARAYFDLASDFLTPPRPRVVAIGGLSGSGKSAVARTIAPDIGSFPGAVHVRSDVERKRLFGVPLDAKLPERAYVPEVSERVYAMCRKRAGMVLEGGQSVIVDAVHAKPQEREAVAALATEYGVPFTGLWLEAPGQVMRERVAKREGDVSDATPAVLEAQLAYDIGPLSFTVVDASPPVRDVAAACLDHITAQD